MGRIVLVLAIVMLFSVANAQVTTYWVEWDRPNKYISGVNIPEGLQLSYEIYMSNSMTKPDMGQQPDFSVQDTRFPLTNEFVKRYIFIRTVAEDQPGVYTPAFNIQLVEIPLNIRIRVDINVN